MICMYFMVFFLFSTLDASSTTDPCKDYRKLNDPDRSSSVKSVDHGYCDSTIYEDWYRSVNDAGTDMPTTYVPYMMCSTTYPIWVNDSLPTNNTEKDVTVCTTTFNSNCSEKRTLKVKNCGDFNVYYLTQTSGCPQRYCFGTKSPCPEGTWSDTGFTPNCGDYPKIPLVLSVTVDLEDGPKASEQFIHRVIKFDCNLQDQPDPENAKNYLFDVRWFIEDNMVADFTNIKLSELYTSYLTEDRWANKYIMGFNVKCQMRVKYEGAIGVGPFSSSDFFYAGFKVGDKEIHIKEGESKKIAVSLTVPVGCYFLRSYGTKSCFINIRFAEPDFSNCEAAAQDGAVTFTNYGCGVHFSYDLWNTEQYIEVQGKFDNKYGDTRAKHISLKVDDTKQHPAWNYAKVPDILVHVFDDDAPVTKGKHCNIINDPLIIPFDRNSQISNQRLGEFIIYQHEIHPTAVHGMFTACPGRSDNRLTCICGIAIRNDVELFIANFCGTISSRYVSSLPANRYIERVSCDDKHMKVVPDGDKYTIILTTGTTIEFTKGLVGPEGIQVPGILNFVIYPSIGDFRKTGGLCGYFDNDIYASNKFVLRDKKFTDNQATFCLDWKVNTSNGDTSLFKEDIVLKKSDVPHRSYCTCRYKTDNSKLISHESPVNVFNCELVEPFEICPDSNVNEARTNAYFVVCGEERSRKRRSSQNGVVKRSVKEDEYDGVFDRIKITYGPDIDKEPVEPTWANGWDQTLAEKHCSERVAADALINICRDVMENSDQEVKMIISQCSEAIKLSGDTSFVESSLDALRLGCITQAKRDVNLTRTASKTGNTSRSILDDLLDVSCPNNCSGNGFCVAGKCDCSNGFEGNLCDLSRSIPPEISQTTNTGKCHTNRKRCTTYGLTGSGFINKAIICRAKHIQIYGDGKIVESSTALTFDGIYINDISCYCTIPGSRSRRAASPSTVIADGYYMSVSNDGITFSDEITFINYDSSCYDCNVTALNCTKLNDLCIKPTMPVPEKDNEEPEGRSAIGIIIAVVVVAVTTILVIVIVAIKLLGKKNKPYTDVDECKVKADINARAHFNPSDYLNSSPPKATQDTKISRSTSSKLFTVKPANPDQKSIKSPRPETPGTISVHFDAPTKREKSPVDLFTISQ